MPDYLSPIALEEVAIQMAKALRPNGRTLANGRRVLTYTRHCAYIAAGIGVMRAHDWELCDAKARRYAAIYETRIKPGS